MEFPCILWCGFFTKICFLQLGHGPGMGTMLAGGAVAAAAAYGAHHLSHGGSHTGHVGHGVGHYGHGKIKHGKFKHGKFGKHGKHGKFKHGKHGGMFGHGGKFKKWK